MIDEKVTRDGPWPLRSVVLGAWQLGEFHTRSIGPMKRLTGLGVLLRYGMMVRRMTHKKVKPMDVDKLVKGWVEATVGMCTAHEKDDYDAHDARADELMGPILTAPIKQVREFYQKLRDALRNDPKVPMLVWMGFEAWGELMVGPAVDDKKILRLKNKLAREIAELVEMDVQHQIPTAIARALRWRDEETLQEVKQVLESGAKPKLVGRQSCLFLEVGRGKKKRQVML